MRPKSILRYTITLALFLNILSARAQDNKEGKQYNNVIRYNISNPLLFGFDRYVLLGYERIVNHNQSFSINFGRASLPRLVNFSTDSFKLKKDSKNSGYNISLDYRFYLGKENKYAAPHGVYIGPFYSYNHFERDNEWTLDRQGDHQLVTTNTNFEISTLGFELGYQFVFWKRITLDLVLVGPGFANYKLHSTSSGGLSDENKTQLQNAVEQLLTQKFPGMNYVFSEKEFDADGRINTWNVGYRYLMNIGFRF
jgi:hypothetical protein